MDGGGGGSFCDEFHKNIPKLYNFVDDMSLLRHPLEFSVYFVSLQVIVLTLISHFLEVDDNYCVAVVGKVETG